MDSLSIHDNELLRFSVDHEKHELLLETVLRESEIEDHVDVLFKDVLAYQFKNDTFGTILFSIDEEDLANLLPTNWQEIQEGSRQSGWLADFSANLESSVEKMQKSGYSGFQISSSIGLSGWIIAKSKTLIRPMN